MDALLMEAASITTELWRCWRWRQPPPPASASCPLARSPSEGQLWAPAALRCGPQSRSPAVIHSRTGELLYYHPAGEKPPPPLGHDHHRHAAQSSKQKPLRSTTPLSAEYFCGAFDYLYPPSRDRSEAEGLYWGGAPGGLREHIAQEAGRETKHGNAAASRSSRKRNTKQQQQYIKVPEDGQTDGRGLQSYQSFISRPPVSRTTAAGQEISLSLMVRDAQEPDTLDLELVTGLKLSALRTAEPSLFSSGSSLRADPVNKETNREVTNRAKRTLAPEQLLHSGPGSGPGGGGGGWEALVLCPDAARSAGCLWGRSRAGRRWCSAQTHGAPRAAWGGRPAAAAQWNSCSSLQNPANELLQ
ncbi:unnamed protein product [Gadus morhua 'NCC']